jgi:hypothetical protein
MAGARVVRAAELVILAVSMLDAVVGMVALAAGSIHI